MKPKPVLIKPPFNSVAVHIKSLGSVEERRAAYQMLRKLRAIPSKEVGFKIPSGDVAWFLRLAANTWERKPSRYDLTPIGKRIMKAWVALAKKSENGFSPSFNPTMRELKTQYAILDGRTPPENPAEVPGWLTELEGLKEIPDDWTFRTTLGRPLRKDPGRPKGSKDRTKRKSRKNSHRKRHR